MSIALTSPLAALWSHVNHRTRSWMALHIVALISIGLWLDIKFGWAGQHFVTVWAFAVWGWLYWLGQQAERTVLVLATVISGLGEVFLSLVWGLYDYQFNNVPLFVPPGHALLMTLGILVARQFATRANAIVAVVSVAAAGWALHVWMADADRFGVVLFGLYALCLCLGRARALYACMFVLALIMELYGTALGNWVWAAHAPWLNLSAANPPYSAGAFYCALDLLVLAILYTRHKNRQLAGVSRS